jgi:hypothetical protein
MKIVLTGSRTLANFEEVQNAFIKALVRTIGIGEVTDHEWHHGGAVGADHNMGAYLELCGVVPKVHRPDYVRYPKQIAPHVRNDEMLDEKPDAVIALWDGTNGGTRSVIEKSAKRGIPTIVEVVWASWTPEPPE